MQSKLDFILFDLQYCQHCLIIKMHLYMLHHTMRGTAVGQFRVQCPTLGHFGMQTRGAMYRTRHPGYWTTCYNSRATAATSV